MKKLMLAAMLLIPASAWADHLDVFAVKLKEDCTLSKYVAIKDDFNKQWGKSHGYMAEIASPVQSDDLVTVYWIGRTKNAETFGKAWDTWRTELSDSGSVASKLVARFQKCTTNESRRGFDTY